MKISVVMATYNGEEYLKEQLESVLVQLPESAQLIISDNGSTDQTVSIINAFNDPRIKLLINTDKKGAVLNFENAILESTGDVIFLCDQDDIWERNKVEICLEYLTKYDIIVSDCKVIDDNNNVVLDSYFKRRKSGKGLLKNLIANTYLGCCMVLKRKVLKIALPFPRSIPMHDIWLGFVGEVFFKTYFLPEKLVRYRSHSKNVSPTSVGVSPFNLLDKFVFRWSIVKYLPFLILRRWKT